MPYAKTDQIGTDPIEDGIEITEEQYQEAIDAMLSGLRIVVEDGAMRFEDSKADPSSSPLAGV